MSTVAGVPVVAIVPVQSSFALFVQGDIKGGEHAHAFRMRVIRDAIEQAFQNNAPPIAEAFKLTGGTAKKSRAYHAGFTALMSIADALKPIPYAKKLSDPANAEVRAKISDATHHAFIRFEQAFLPIWNIKPVKKSPVVAPVVAPEMNPEQSTAGNTGTRTVSAEIDAMVTGVIGAIALGTLTGAQLDDIEAKISEYRAQCVLIAMAKAPVAPVAPIVVAPKRMTKKEKADDIARTLEISNLLKVDGAISMGLAHA